MQSEIIILQILHPPALLHVEVPLCEKCTSDFCGMKTPRTAHRIDNGTKSLRQRQWSPAPYHAWGNSTRGSSTAENHKSQPSRIASKHIPVRP